MAKSRDERLQEIAAKFRRDVQKLGLGVSIKAGDGPWIKVTEPPPESDVSEPPAAPKAV